MQKFTGEGKLKAGKGFDTKLKAEYADGNLSLEKLELSSKGTLAGELKLSGVADGVDLTFEAEEALRGAAAISKGVVGAAYKNADVNAKLALDLINGPTATASVLGKYEGFLLGGTAVFNTGINGDERKEGDDKSAAGLESYGVAIGYEGADFRVAAVTKGLDSATVGVHHSVSADVALACVAEFDIPKKGAGNKWDMSLGGSYKLSADSSLQGKLSAGGRVDGNITQKLSSNVTLKAAASIDAANLGADNHTLGLGLEFSA